MRLGFILLDNTSDVNNFKEVTELTLSEGNPSTLYFRIVQLDRSCEDDHLRFVPPAPASAAVSFDCINDANDLTDLVAGQPFVADDRSIWSVPILPDYLIGPDSMSVALTFGGQVYNLEALSSIRQAPKGDKRFFC